MTQRTDALVSNHPSLRSWPRSAAHRKPSRPWLRAPAGEVQSRRRLLSPKREYRPWTSFENQPLESGIRTAPNRRSRRSEKSTSKTTAARRLSGWDDLRQAGAARRRHSLGHRPEGQRQPRRGRRTAGAAASAATGNSGWNCEPSHRGMVAQSRRTRRGCRPGNLLAPGRQLRATLGRVVELYRRRWCPDLGHAVGFRRSCPARAPAISPRRIVPPLSTIPSCSESIEMTGRGVAWSHSVEFAGRQPEHVDAEFNDHHLEPEAKTEIGHLIPLGGQRAASTFPSRSRRRTLPAPERRRHLPAATRPVLFHLLGVGIRRIRTSTWSWTPAWIKDSFTDR